MPDFHIMLVIQRKDTAPPHALSSVRRGEPRLVADEPRFRPRLRTRSRVFLRPFDGPAERMGEVSRIAMAARSIARSAGMRMRQPQRTNQQRPSAPALPLIFAPSPATAAGLLLPCLEKQLFPIAGPCATRIGSPTQMPRHNQCFYSCTHISTTIGT